MARPERIFMLRYEDERTKVSVVDGSSAQEMQQVLTEVGSRLSDVFGSDALIWVEGATEEICFPEILKANGSRLVAGVSIVPVVNTSEFEGKYVTIETAWKIYERLSAANALMPRAVAFSFDRERRPQNVIDELMRRSNGMVKFLPRRTYENYLIHVPAITAVLNKTETFRESPISESRVDEWIKQNS